MGTSPNWGSHRNADRRMAQQAGKPKVSDAGSAITIDQNVALRTVRSQLNGMLGGITYAFQVCVHRRPVVQVFQSTSHICQLKKHVNRGLASGIGKNAHQFEPICLRERSDEVHDSTVFHPLGNHYQVWWRHFCAHQL